ncbi:hypothetical protein ABIF74_011766 [Bradyrhizobium japonicum]
MPRLTIDQIEFAKTMTVKQRRALQGLAMFDCYMSASEIGDQEMRDLVASGLAQYYAQPGAGGRVSWGATDAGRVISHRIRKGVL